MKIVANDDRNPWNLHLSDVPLILLNVMVGPALVVIAVGISLWRNR